MGVYGSKYFDQVILSKMREGDIEKDVELETGKVNETVAKFKQITMYCMHIDSYQAILKKMPNWI